MKLLKKAMCILSCAALLTCATAPAFAASTSGDSAVVYADNDYQYEYRGPLTIEGHLAARIGYSVAAYHFYIYAPSDAVGIQINDMPIATTNAIMVNGGAEFHPDGTSFGDVTFKITVYYSDRAPYTTYETFDLDSYWCGVEHPLSDHCYI